jgi:N-methylhydantoinase A
MVRTDKIRFTIDTGGTFTDIVVTGGGSSKFTIDKVATTPENTLIGILNAIDKVKIDLTLVDRFFIHGSTTALNALLERKGVKCAYVATRGFRDIPEIMRYNRPQMYNPKYMKPLQFIPRELRFELKERVNHKGEIIVPLDEKEVINLAARLKKESVEAVAVCLLHSFKNNIHERIIKQILEREMEGVSVSISSVIAPEHREFERSITTMLNAYLAPVVEGWISSLEDELRARGFAGEIIITRSDGGGMVADGAKQSPINMLLSGPSGGVTGAAYLARLIGQPNLITMDVGGTSFDVAMIKNGAPSTSTMTEIGGFPILIPNLDIRTIGAGGGSLASVDEGGALRMGPESAGAQPGPICYRRGGVRPTTTDAFLVNGFINAKNFLGGEMDLDVVGAKEGISNYVAKPLKLGLHEAAGGMLRIAMSNMAEAVKDITSETGDDPRDYAMLCFGGGGAMFGSFIMDELNLPAAIVPIAPSVFSAWGMMMIDLRHDLTHALTRSLESVPGAELEEIFRHLFREGRNLLTAEGVALEDQVITRLAEMRYQGQEHTVTVEAEFDLSVEGSHERIYADFQDAYARIYGYKLTIPADIVNLRASAVGKIPKPEVPLIEIGERDSRNAKTGEREFYDFLSQKTEIALIYNRDQLKASNVINGPAIVEEATTLTIIRANQECVVDKFGNLVIKRSSE